jgi:alpha-galactosidase
MRMRVALSGCAVLFVALALARAEGPGRTPLETKDRWVSERLLRTDTPVFSFVYDGMPSSQLLAGWTKSPVETSQLAAGRTQRVLRWTDPRTGLEVRLVSVDYADSPAVEWTVYLANHGTAPTPILERLEGIDASFDRSPEETRLRTTQGDNFSASSYEPLSYELTGEARSFEPVGGRPTNGAWPYFNVDYGQRGVIIAVGWPGQWQAKFSRAQGSVLVAAGQETTHLRLQPGEEIRTPLVALLFWKGSDWIAGQNQWRHWFLAYNIPRPGGNLPPLASMVCPAGLFTSAKGDISFLDSYLNRGFRPDYLWVDAGWYPTDHDWFQAKGVGTWKPDPERYPHGIREVSDYAHSKGMGFVLWFEPERVYRGSDLWNLHTDWLLNWNDKDHVDLRLLNLGNPQARQWLTDYISRFISAEGIDIYRQDFNVDPLKAWQNADTPDRQGMTENLYVQGYLAYWDGLLHDHPRLMIDSCASGGRRNDLETLRRGVPLLRSDYQAPNLPGSGESMSTDVFDGNQGHTYGLSLWVPYFGTGEYADDEYSARSHLCPWLGVGTHAEHPDWPALTRQLSDHAAVAKYFYGDFYPITPYSKSEKVWFAWEFLLPASGEGVVQAFRRENNPETDVHLKLAALDPEARYEFKDIDTGSTQQATGKELMAEGLHLYSAAPRSALIFTFKKL